MSTSRPYYILQSVFLSLNQATDGGFVLGAQSLQVDRITIISIPIGPVTKPPASGPVRVPKNVYNKCLQLFTVACIQTFLEIWQPVSGYSMNHYRNFLRVLMHNCRQNNNLFFFTKVQSLSQKNSPPQVSFMLAFSRCSTEENLVANDMGCTQVGRYGQDKKAPRWAAFSEMCSSLFDTAHKARQASGPKCDNC